MISDWRSSKGGKRSKPGAKSNAIYVRDSDSDSDDEEEEEEEEDVQPDANHKDQMKQLTQQIKANASEKGVGTAAKAEQKQARSQQLYKQFDDDTDEAEFGRLLRAADLLVKVVHAIGANNSAIVLKYKNSIARLLMCQETGKLERFLAHITDVKVICSGFSEGATKAAEVRLFQNHHNCRKEPAHRPPPGAITEPRRDKFTCFPRLFLNHHNCRRGPAPSS